MSFPCLDYRDGLYIGIMSGTSLDGIDASLVKITAGVCSVLDFFHRPFPSNLRHQILALQQSTHDELRRASLLAKFLTELYAQTVHDLLTKNIKQGTQEVMAIGCHGQTVRHQPLDGYTIQLCNPSLLAELVGIHVVADFRSRDIAAGGEGAPLVPAFHDQLFRSKTCNRVIVNIGGMANVTFLPISGDVYGFDSGPGNVLMDAWVQGHLGLDYDFNGRWAQTGSVIKALLEKLLGHAFFIRTPPKSTGREDFSLDWLKSYFKPSFRPQDVQATLLELSALTISDAIHTQYKYADEVYVCGGGAYNKALIQSLKRHLQNGRIKEVETTMKLGVEPQWVEAAAFAWLAHQTITGRTSNLPSVTGARHRCILGALYQA